MVRTFIIVIVLAAGMLGAGLYHWTRTPITDGGAVVPFAIEAGSGIAQSADQIAQAGVPVNPILFTLFARASGRGHKIKAGSYELKPDTTPQRLLDQLVRGEFAQESLAVIEGWTFRQMRLAINAHTGLKHDTAQLSERELLEKLKLDYPAAEGLFFPDTYLFAKGSSDLHVYRQAHQLLKKRLDDAWAARDPALPYKTPYDALIMASIVEKETGAKADRPMIAGVFINRLKRGMLLQTDPTVIYGVGDKYDGKIYKRDLETDTPFNTYTRVGLPPTPIALPGVAALHAALAPARTDALYFVARGDGSSEFSGTLLEHNRAVQKYLRGRGN
ncbi:MAG TPA: endolytic transglycosylase MltG [Burkholderiaceae bacterium]